MQIQPEDKGKRTLVDIFKTLDKSTISILYIFLPVEYSVVQSSFLVEMSSSCGSSMPLSTSSGIVGSQMNTRSWVVWETGGKGQIEEDSFHYFGLGNVESRVECELSGGMG